MPITVVTDLGFSDHDTAQCHDRSWRQPPSIEHGCDQAGDELRGRWTFTEPFDVLDRRRPPSRASDARLASIASLVHLANHRHDAHESCSISSHMVHGVVPYRWSRTGRPARTRRRPQLDDLSISICVDQRHRYRHVMVDPFGFEPEFFEPFVEAVEAPAHFLLDLDGHSTDLSTELGDASHVPV